MGKTYKSSGVNIDAGEETLRRIKRTVAETFTASVLTDLGAFGAVYDGRFSGYREPVLVSSVDGVGTKLKVAALFNRHDTIGQDLVNHCVNDILACGARPLFFLDYFATGRLDPAVAEQVITGLAVACKQNECSLIGGESAEMPGMYAPTEYDIAGTIVGIAEKSKLLTRNLVQTGDRLIGVRSSGLHTNGYSLARAVLLEHFSLDSYFDELGCDLGTELLKIHRSYFHVFAPMLDRGLLHGLSHITGGGIVGNTRRILAQGQRLSIDWNAWERPPIFTMIQNLGKVPEEDMRRTFNLGIGAIAIVSDEKADTVFTLLRESGENPVFMGEVVAE